MFANKRRHYLTMVALLALVTALAAAAKEPNVNVLRIIRQHRVTVVTTEPPDKLQKYWLLWGVNPMPVMSVADFVVNRDKLPGDGDVIFIIDRTKKGTTRPEIEQLLPLPTAAVGAREVLTYCSKTAYKRGSRFKNGWDILVSSPDEKWLHDELSHLQEILNRQVSESQPTKLHWFTVRKLKVISTEGRQAAENWIKPQSHREGQGQVFEWDYTDADLWIPNPEDTSDLLFLISTEKLSDKSKPIIDALPKDLREWYASPASSSECAACKANTDDREVAAVVSPSGRHLARTLKTDYTGLARIPESLARHRLVDLSIFGRVAVKVWSGDSAAGDQQMLDDLASKLTAELQRANVGLEFVSKQHVKLIAFSGGKLQAEDVSSVRREAGPAGALAVLDLVGVDLQTRYAANEPKCTTQPYPGFSRSKPSQPHQPKPDDRKLGLIGAHKYDEVDGSRSNDPDFIADEKNWREVLMPQYRRELQHWEQARAEYEDTRRAHEMDWLLSSDCIQSATISGNLHIYDMRRSSSSAGSEVFACPVRGAVERRNAHKSFHVSVRGEGNRPDSPALPAAVGSAGTSVVSGAFETACGELVNKLSNVAILPSDRPDRVVRDVAPPVTGERPTEVTHVTAEGEADSMLADAKDRAVTAALSNAVQQGIGVYVQQTTVGANYEVIKNEILAKSGGFAKLDEVLSESTTGGILKVKVKASVSNRPLAEKLKALGLTHEWTVGVSLPGALNGASTDAPVSAAELAIVQQLRDAGFRVLDDAQRKKLMQNEVAARAIKGDAKALAELKREFDVDILVTGTATAEYLDQLAEGGITSYRTRGTIQARALLTDTGSVLSTAATEGEGIDQTKDLAASIALSDMGERVGTKLAEDILLAPAALEPFVTVKITGLKSAAAASKLEEAFRDLPGVKQAKRQRFSGGTLELGVYVRAEYWDLLPDKLCSSKLGKQLGLKLDKWTKALLQVHVAKG